MLPKYYQDKIYPIDTQCCSEYCYFCQEKDEITLLMADQETMNNFISLSNLVKKNAYKGYEFDDFLGSKFLSTMSFGNLFIKRVFVQVGKFLPVNIRPFIGIRKLESTKANAFFAKGYLYAFKASSYEKWLQEAVRLLNWLLESYSTGYSGLAWGNAFDFASRGGFYKKGLPTIVWTSHINNTFYLAYKETRFDRYKDAVISSTDFISKDLERYEDNNGTCLAYAPGLLSLVHNSNLLGAAALLRAWTLDNDREKYNLAQKAFSWSIGHMNTDGSWYYGIGKKYRWIDNFHTAYVLDCLVEGHLIGGEVMVPWQVIDLTFKFWRKNFFLEDGTPKYYHNKKYPIDVQCAAQAIESFAKYSEINQSALSDAYKVYKWTIKHQRKRNGGFIFQKRRFYTNKLESIHWGQSTMLLALGILSYYLSEGR